MFDMVSLASGEVERSEECGGGRRGMSRGGGVEERVHRSATEKQRSVSGIVVYSVEGSELC